MTKHDELRAETDRRNKEHAAKIRREAEAKGTHLVKIKKIKARVSNDEWADPYIYAIPEDPNLPDYYLSGVGVTDPEDIAFNLTISKARRIVAEAKESGFINKFDYEPHYSYGSKAYVAEGLEEFAILADKTGDNSYLDY